MFFFLIVLSKQCYWNSGALIEKYWFIDSTAVLATCALLVFALLPHTL